MTTSSSTDIPLFERALRANLRFRSPQGLLTTEDLWGLPLEQPGRASLESIGDALLAERQALPTETIRREGRSARARDILDLKIDVVRHIVAVREAEIQAKTLAASRASERARLDALIVERSLSEASLDELKVLRDALGAA